MTCLCAFGSDPTSLNGIPIGNINLGMSIWLQKDVGYELTVLAIDEYIGNLNGILTCP